MGKTNQAYEKAASNIDLFKKLIREKVEGERSALLLQLVESVEDKLIAAPASTRLEYQGAYPGGLVEHSINVVKTMVALNKAYDANLSSDQIVVTGLFHDIGKVGNGKEEYYLSKNSSWHREQGIIYEVNKLLVNIPVSLRSLYLLQTHRITLDECEHYAISSIRDRPRMGDENLSVANEPMLAVVLQQAVRTTALRNRGRTSLLT